MFKKKENQENRENKEEKENNCPCSTSTNVLVFIIPGIF